MGEIASSSDNKVSVRALMEKIAFPAEKYQLGHTKVFFRAGALAYLEELRDGIVLKLVRWMQGQCYGVIRRKVYNTNPFSLLHRIWIYAENKEFNASVLPY